MYKLLLTFAILGLAASVPAPNINDARIVGGEGIDIKEAPYQVSIRFADRHLCGGSIISDDAVITAAHCIMFPFPEDYSVRVGSSSNDKGGEIIRVRTFQIHPQFSYSNMDSDVAVLLLKMPFRFNDEIAPITMASSEDVIEIGEVTTVTGWGALSEGGASSNALQRVFIPKVSKDVCSAAYEPKYTITSRMICASAPGGGKDACQGDSGGPMVYKGKLVGIVSWGVGCARPEYPGVYARVSAFKDWVESSVQYMRIKSLLRL